MDPETEANYLSKLKHAIEKGQLKRYGTFALVIVMIVLLINIIVGDPLFENPTGYAIEDTAKTCEEIKGICSEEPCTEGYKGTGNYCPNDDFCCKKN